ncbi:unnamed protein product [Paramecium primaurelia]|uniref:Uncharacterized protein n=1 Tax=Paramecium primaurelia TaxID=5886 RepID=A0A8S1MWZ6_PARPR|nr:unnamed protein product [Paramecium primaurelia]
MNIKIVYNTKTHKISQKHQTLQEIKNAILTLYPQQLEGGFDLYVTLHPQMDPFKILDDTCFQRIKELYNQLKWASIKFLVKDLINPNLTNDDISILNQSMIAQSTVQLSKFNDLFQQKPEPKQEEIQKKKENIVNEENKPETNFVQQIVNEIQKQEIQELDYHSEEFKQFIIQQIDERLKYHGIFKNEISNPKIPEYRMQLLTRDFQISKFANQKFEIQVEIINTCDFIWRKTNVVLMGVSGYYKNFLIQLEHDINPGEVAKFICYCQMPNYAVYDLGSEFQLAYNDQNQRKFFGDKVSLRITTQINNANIPNQPKIDQKKVKLLMDNAEISKEQAVEFIQIYGVDNPIEEIIIAYFEQPK